MHGRIGKGSCLESSRLRERPGVRVPLHPPFQLQPSSTVEHAAVNRVVPGSSPGAGATGGWFNGRERRSPKPKTQVRFLHPLPMGSWRKGQRRGLIIPGLQVRVLPGPPHVPVSLSGKTPDSGSGMVGSSPAREATCQFSLKSTCHPPLIAQVAAGLRQRNDRRVPMGLIEARTLEAELAPYAPVAQ